MQSTKGWENITYWLLICVSTKNGPIIDYLKADLIDGACGAAFHGLIETGWAVSNGDPQNIAEGLAYFTMVCCIKM